MRFFKLKLFNQKAEMAWDTIGKIILVLVFLVIVLVILGMILNTSFGLVDKIKSIFGG